MDVLLAALGTNSYTPTRYAGYEIESPYFTYVLIGEHRPDKVILLLTKKAKETHWDAESYDYKDNGDTKSHPTLRKVLEASGYGQDRVSIPEEFPDGRDEGELWTAFNIIIEAVPENCNLILDVTNGFRTLPMLMLLAAIYLRQAKNVSLKGIYYGAFEAAKEGQRPVFQLTQFITLADWANAVRVFKLTGDTALLAESLSSLSETGSSESLKNASEQLKTFATYLDLGLSLEVQASSAQLCKNLEAAEADLAERHKAFKTLLEQVRGELESFDQSDPRNLDQMEKTLKRQLSLIRWLKKKRTSTATLLAQEWIVSQGMVQKEERKSIFEWNTRRNTRRKIKNPQIETLSKLRNQLAHGGWTADPLDVREAVDEVERIIDALQEDTVIPEAAPKHKQTKKKSNKGKKPKRR